MLGVVSRVASGSTTAPLALRTGIHKPISSVRAVVREVHTSSDNAKQPICKRCYGTTSPSGAAKQSHTTLPASQSGLALNGKTGSVLPPTPVKLEWRQYSSLSNGSSGAQQHVPVIRSLSQLRRWRRQAREEGLEVGVVPTMGALHQGHLDLVKASLQRHPLTVMTLFVNPMQFAPTEDLAAYPRTLERDLDLLRTLLPPNPSSSLRGLGVSESDGRRPAGSSSSCSDGMRGLGVSESDGARPSAVTSTPACLQGLGSLVVFAPGPDVMYPLKGDLQDLGRKRGVEVDVKGWGDVMEGASRPQFFKGVATVCTKLFNAVEPDHAYFGQKDIQQALLLKIMLQDLLLAHPLPENMHILPTTRAADGLALSSRNAYLSPAEREVAPTLYKALDAAREQYRSAVPTSPSNPSASDTAQGVTGEDLVSTATELILAEAQRLLDTAPSGTATGGAEIKLDYVEVFDKHTFEPVRGKVEKGREMVIAGAMWVGGTRLIDNLLLGWGEGWEV